MGACLHIAFVIAASQPVGHGLGAGLNRVPPLKGGNTQRHKLG